MSPFAIWRQAPTCNIGGSYLGIMLKLLCPLHHHWPVMRVSHVSLRAERLC